MTNLEGWDLNAGSGGSKNSFTKFPEGITRIRILDKAPHIRWTHWLPQFSRKLTCPGFGCPIDEIIKTAKANKTKSPYNSVRQYSLNVFNQDTGQREILEEGITMFDELKVAIMDAITDNVGTSIGDYIYKVRKRVGTDGKAKWSVTSEYVPELSDDEKEALNNLVDFKEMHKPPTIEQVHELLAFQGSNKDEWTDGWMTIMGYKKAEEPDEALGVEIED